MSSGFYFDFSTELSTSAGLSLVERLPPPRLYSQKRSLSYLFIIVVHLYRSIIVGIYNSRRRRQAWLTTGAPLCRRVCRRTPFPLRCCAEPVWFIGRCNGALSRSSRAGSVGVACVS